MPHIVGTSGDDSLEGTSAADLIEGLGGDDTIVDEHDYGNDTILGGEGNDTIIVSRFGQTTPPGTLTIDGGAGDDFLRIGPVYGRNVSIIGGTGADRIELDNAAIYTIDAGADDDLIKITATHGQLQTIAQITTGTGSDTLLLSYATHGATIPDFDIVITDFTAGDAGDRIDFGDFFARIDTQPDPIASLVQQGAHAVLTFLKGGAITFLNTSAASLTAVNLGGYTTGGLVSYSLNGTAGDDIMSGQLGDDDVHGGAGDDILTGGYGDDALFGDGDDDELNGGAGRDVLHGGEGNDVLRDIVGTGDVLHGDGGNDTLIFTRDINGPGGSVEMYGGEGDDSFLIEGPFPIDLHLEGGIGADVARIGPAGGFLDLGEGDDAIIFGPSSGETISVFLGAGSDRIAVEGGIPTRFFADGIHIRDFQTGDGGDIIDVFSFISRDWDYATNPVGNGFNLGLIKLDGVNFANLTAFNYDGFAPDGSPFAGANFTGGAGADNLVGGRGGDLMQGLGGNDVIRGHWGNDQIDGGADADDLDGEGGSDTIDGGAGNDLIADLIQGSDTLSGGEGNDTIIVRRDYAITTTVSVVALDGGIGDDVISIDYAMPAGGGPTPVIQGSIDGGDGNDIIDVARLTLADIDGGIGNDLIRIHEMSGEIDAGAGDDRIELLSTDNRIGATMTLGSGRDVVLLAKGPDGTVGPDKIVLDFQTGAAGDRIELLFGYQIVQQGPHTLIMDNSGITQLVLRNVNAASLTPENVGRAILGTPGNDVLLHGGPGQDRMEGGTGDDIYYVDTFNDIVNELSGQGNDAVYAYVSYQLTANSHVETLSTVSHAATAAINLTGNGLNQTIVGNAGANILHGGGGTDYLLGLGGNDVYYTDNLATIVYEAAGGGNDTLYTSVSYVLSATSIEVLSASNHGATTPLSFTGNYMNNVIIGNAGANVLHGGGGVDVLSGLGGNDIYYTDTAATQIVEQNGGGTDTLYTSVSYVLAAGVDLEVLSTNSHAATAAINLTGNNAANLLFGNAGQNDLDGGIGRDTLTGFGGADRFNFSTIPTSNNFDRIMDFQVGVDKIALEDFVFHLPVGALSPNAFHVGTAAQDADDRIVYDSATGFLYFDADGSGGGAADLFAILQSAPLIGASDFAVI